MSKKLPNAEDTFAKMFGVNREGESPVPNTQTNINCDANSGEGAGEKTPEIKKAPETEKSDVAAATPCTIPKHIGQKVYLTPDLIYALKEKALNEGGDISSHVRAAIKAYVSLPTNTPHD